MQLTPSQELSAIGSLTPTEGHVSSTDAKTTESNSPGKTIPNSPTVSWSPPSKICLHCNEKERFRSTVWCLDCIRFWHKRRDEATHRVLMAQATGNPEYWLVTGAYGQKEGQK